MDGCKFFSRNDISSALVCFKKAATLADGAFMAGFVLLQQKKLMDSIRYLKQAKVSYRQLGKIFFRHGVKIEVTIEITEKITARIEPDYRGVILALAECYQATGQQQLALSEIEHLRKLMPDDKFVKASYIELLLEIEKADSVILKRILRLTDGIKATTKINSELLDFREQASSLLLKAGTTRVFSQK